LKIKTIKLKNIFIFEDFIIKFKEGLNIINFNDRKINLNIMKVLYAMYENDKHIGKVNFDLSYTYFKSNAMELVNDKINIIDKNPYIEITYKDKGIFSYDLLKYEGNKFELNGLDKFKLGNPNKIIFIPSENAIFDDGELFENYNEYKNTTDKTDIDLFNRIKKRPKSYISIEYKVIMNKIINIIQGTPIHRGNEFYIKRNDKEFRLSNEKIEVKKLAILYFLIENNDIQNQKIIVWPEAKKHIKNCNKYIIDDILRLLVKENKQVFISN